jgi:hypothetical protein
MAMPTGTFFTQMTTPKGEAMLALAIPHPSGSFQTIPYVLKNGTPALINNMIYQKKEKAYWKKFDSDEELYKISEN